jgi:hypothetical protein
MLEQVSRMGSSHQNEGKISYKDVRKFNKKTDMHSKYRNGVTQVRQRIR